jgi:predicted RNase H-like HicB family nuclease
MEEIYARIESFEKAMEEADQKIALGIQELEALFVHFI